jgi:DNA repair exonuclease SbcCD ATPase subunit
MGARRPWNAIKQRAGGDTADTEKTLRRGEFPGAKRITNSNDDTLPAARRMTNQNDDTLPAARRMTNQNDDTLPTARPVISSRITNSQFDSSKSSKTDSVEDLKRQLVVLQATLSSTEDRFQDAKKRHEREIQQLQAEHQKELGDLSGGGTVDSPQPSLKEGLLRSQNAALQTQLADMEREHQDREAIFQERIKKLERQVLHDGGDNASHSRRPSAQDQSNMLLLELQVKKLKLEKDQAANAARLEAQDELDQLRSENQAIEEKLRTMTSKVEKLERDHHVQATQWSAKEFDMQQRIDTFEMLVADLEEKQQHGSDGDADVDKLQSELDTANQNISEMLELYMSVEQERDRLKGELDQAQQNAPATQYISNDTELMQFIEVMTSKVNAYKSEVETLKAENETSSASSQSISGETAHYDDTLRRDLEAAMEREERLQQELNGLFKEFDRLSLSYANVQEEHHKSNTILADLRDQLTKNQERLHEELAKNLNRSANDDRTDTPAIQLLKKDMRNQLMEIRTEYGDALQREIDMRMQSEKELRSMRRDLEMKAYAKNNEATQTIDSFLSSPTQQQER